MKPPKEIWLQWYGEDSIIDNDKDDTGITGEGIIRS